MHLAPHHLIFGELSEVDAFNWTLKVKSRGVKGAYSFEQYEGGYDEFLDEFKRSFEDPRRFTYTPILMCRGKKPY